MFIETTRVTNQSALCLWLFALRSHPTDPLAPAELPVGGHRVLLLSFPGDISPK
jgi:hypothetical protein